MNLVEMAREFAKKAHVGQVRKLSNEPYFYHLEGVAKILETAGLPEEVVAAGYLHDVVEDTEVNADEVESIFGSLVAGIVQGNTEDKRLSWEERKQHTIDHIQTSSFYVKALIGADKLDNINSMIEAYQKYGNEIWSHFQRGQEQQLWYYTTLSEKLLTSSGEKAPSYFYELKEKVDELRAMK